MKPAWALTDLEFVLLCEEHGCTELPIPFTFTSRTWLAADYRAERARTLRELRERDDAGLPVLGEALTRPDITVVAQAWDEQEPENPQGWTRVHGIRQRARGFVITERPGETIWHSGGFDVSACDPHALADAVLDLLPSAEAGRMRQITLIDPETPSDARPFVPLISDDDEPEDDEAYRSASYLNTPATATGSVRVLQGRSMFGPRGRVGVHEAARGEVVARGAALDEVGGQRERCAREPDERRALELRDGALDPHEDGAQPVVVERAEVPQALHVVERAHRGRDDAARAGHDVDVDPDEPQRHDDVGEEDGGVDPVAAHRLQRDLGDEVRVEAGVEHRHAGARRAVLGERAAGLAHEPHRKAVRAGPGIGGHQCGPGGAAVTERMVW